MPWITLKNLTSSPVVVAELSLTVPADPGNGAHITVKATGDTIASLSNTYEGRLALSIGHDSTSAEALADLLDSIPSLPSNVASGIMKRNSGNTAWVLVVPKDILKEAGAAIDVNGQKLINVPAGQWVWGVVAGRNNVGAVTLTGAKVGDRVVLALEVTTGADGANAAASFEAAITVAGQIQQTNAGDLSTKKFAFLLWSES